MNKFFRMVIAIMAITLLKSTLADDLYMVQSQQVKGQVSVTANKQYNSLDHSGNKTIINVEIVSPLINNADQEIRIALQWQWDEYLGSSSERVVFYGKVGNQRFEHYRVDQHPYVDNAYMFQNWYAPALPKDYIYLQEVKNSDGKDRYQIIDFMRQEIFLDNHTAMFTFIIDRDEPVGLDNKLWINWGVFDNEYDDDSAKCHGQHDPHIFEIQNEFSDFFDRVLIRLLWEQITWTSLLGWAAPIFQIVSSVALVGRVMVEPLLIFIRIEPSENFTFDSYITQVFFRWQFLNTYGVAIIWTVEMLAIAVPIAYVLTRYFITNPTITSFDQFVQGFQQFLNYIDWIIFAVLFTIGQLSQLITNWRVGEFVRQELSK